MQKIVAFLEQHVQWVAIGLGALFVLFMTYSYVLTPVAEVQIGSETLTSGEVDPYTVDHVVKGLKSAIYNNEKINLQVPQYVGAFKDAMSWKNAQPLVFAGNWNAQTLDVTLPNQTPVPGTPGAIVVGTNQPPIPGGVEKVAALPVPPKAIPDASRFGRSLILPPQANGQAPQLPPPGQDAVGSVDKDWVTQLFKLDLGELAAAFEKSNIPPQFRQTTFLKVELVRQEKMPDGSWGNEQIIPPLGVWRAGQLPPPFPAEGQPRGIQAQYLTWATTNTPDIIQPLFFTTIPGKGDQWTKPGQQATGAVPFNPNTWVGGKGTLTDEQWQMVLNARREKIRLQNEQKNLNRPKPVPKTPGAPGSPGGIGNPFGQAFNAPAQPNYAPPPPSGHTQFQARQPGIPPMPFDMGGLEGPMGIGGMGGGFGGAPVAAGLPQPGTDYPNGEFDPSLLQWKDKTIEIWAHDDTVQSGKTYQYKMRYKLKNPIFGAGNVAVDDKLSEQFALTSLDSDWTPSLTVPSQVNFFVASSSLGKITTIRFQIFRWDKGEQKKEDFVVGQGDLVGGMKGAVDFSTDWTVVDIRDESRTGDTQVFLLNNTDGSVIVRSSKTDANDPLYTSLKEQVLAKAAEAAASAAGAPGTVIPPGGTVPGISRGGVQPGGRGRSVGQ